MPLTQLYQLTGHFINDLNKIFDSGSLYNYKSGMFLTFSKLFFDRMHMLNGNYCNIIINIMEKAIT